jgi:hypothetical protein
MALATHLLREGIADLRTTRAKAEIELRERGAPAGLIRGELFLIDREIERLEEALAILHQAENPLSILVPADHPMLPGIH